MTGRLLAISEDHKTDDVQLVFLNGGMNDVEFGEVLDPEGPSLDAVNKAIDRAFGDSLARVLARATIASLADHVVAPGIVYAHPAFLPGHALFAGPQSLVHSCYR